ncbi:hypothetical protein BKP45_03165 [Anaerobacillus alkalidiazotrophicus]|uniref:Uncharacterized protein n=1 Tax=Anaerobacillus alkalidiazotrophicus TaxID=472963 RepID=A0A1S2MB31_9BACI|nr:hypothetical protein [Anaerobacillus alkalidiazotrophicus]OIJ21713.1 hypothetical protein BKP45_03165 [Anaerobacillus alkalidiazotrophicus]
MKPGNIKQFSHLREFTTLQQFNETIKHVLSQHGDEFTKGERLAFTILTRFSVKEIGICNARICKLVEAAQAQKGGVSRSTFERMLRKAKQLGVLSIHHTTRKKGGYSHNVYVFHRFDGTLIEKLTDRQTTEKSTTPTLPNEKIPAETSKLENKIKDKDLRPITLDSLDHTFVPSYVPKPFTKIVKPFFDRAKQICELWDRALIAYRQMKFTEAIESLLPTITEAFKETVYKYKQGKIKKSFHAYFYGTVAGKLIVEKRKMVATKSLFSLWLRK